MKKKNVLDLVDQHPYIVITPDGVGSKGDEAMISGCLSLLKGKKALLVTPNRNQWCDELLGRTHLFEECCVELQDMPALFQKPHWLIMLGADTLDGSCGYEAAHWRLEAIKSAVAHGGKVVVFCSIRSDMDPRLIDEWKSLPESVMVFLRDSVTEENFADQIGRPAKHFSDLAFFAQPLETARSKAFCDQIKTTANGNRVIGLEISETMFRSFNTELTDDKRREFAWNVASLAAQRLSPDDTIFVLLTHDTRSWDAHWSDYQYACAAAERLSGVEGFTYLIQPPELTQAELLNVLPLCDLLICGRMHMSITACCAGTVPLVVAGTGKNYVMVDKVRGMCREWLGTDQNLILDLNQIPQLRDIVLSETALQGALAEKRTALSELLPAEREQMAATLGIRGGAGASMSAEEESLIQALARSAQLNRDLVAEEALRKNKEAHIEQLLRSERELSARCEQLRIELEEVQNHLSGQLNNVTIERDQLLEKENQLRGELIQTQCAKDDLENELRSQMTLLECAKNDLENDLRGQMNNVVIERDQLLAKENELRGELIRTQCALNDLENDLRGQLIQAQCAKDDLENDLRGQLIQAECAKNDLENDLLGQLTNAQIERDQLMQKENDLKAKLASVSLELEVLSDRVVKYSYSIDRMREAQEELNGRLMCSEGECAQLRDKENRLLHTVSVKDEEYAKLQYELACREAECQQLRNKENQLKADLEATRNSRTWRLARVFAGFVRFFVPVGSKRALFLRLLWTFVKHPFKFLKSLSPRKVKKFFRLLRRGDVEGIKLLIHSNITGEPVPSTIEVVAPEVVAVEAEPEREKTVEDYPVIRVPQWEDPQVSIVIPVYNQFEFTYHCVESIIKNSGEITYEIIIANDCSTDLTTHIDEILPGVKCITNEKNLRFLLNCNNAAKHAKGQYVLFLNNDTQVQPNWLEPLVTLIESADDIGMVGSKLIYPDGLLQEAGGILWKDGSAWNFGNRQNPALPQFNYVKQVDYISGAAIMLSRALWEEIGGFDETFVPAYCEDSDLAFTVRKMGYRVMYQPLSVVVHFEGVSNGTDTSSGQKHYQVVNSKKFREKWAEELAKHPDNAENVFQARDYSFGKPTLLMVDHYVPHFDKDAGSRTVYQYLKLFVKAGFNVKFIGDNFYQHEPYTTALQQMGIEVLYGPECAQHWKDWIRDNAEHIDYVFLNRPHIAPKYLEFIRQNTKARIIYYGHDLAFLREMREYEITGDSSFRDSAIEWKPKELALMRAADMAYYPSYVEVDEIHAIDPTIKVKAIPAYLFENVKWEGYDHAARKDIMFIGGFGHRPNVDAVKWVADEILPELLKYLPDVKIHILGSNAPKEVLELASEHLVIEGFVTDEQLEWFYRNMRISLVPLRYGAGIKGKVVEAMRYGTPVVTTSTGAEGIPDAEKAMLIEDDGKELARKLAELYNDAEKLTSMSQNCIGYIQDNYSPSNAISVIGPEFDLC